jgi:hypothetical protein
MAEKIPAIGGVPEAKAIPKQRGRAIRNTKKPESTSLFQFWTNPAIPSLGTSMWVVGLLIGV